MLEATEDAKGYLNAELREEKKGYVKSSTDAARSTDDQSWSHWYWCEVVAKTAKSWGWGYQLMRLVNVEGEDTVA